MTKIVSFVNPNFQQGPKELNAYYFPYSVGVLWSYVMSFDHLEEKYDLGEFIWRRDPIEEAVEQLKDSDIVGFSTYIWNNNYNNVLARKLKEANPNILVIFGGPEPPIEDPEFFERFPYIDLCVKTEGEHSFKRILESNSFADYYDIPGMLINQAADPNLITHHSKTIDTGSAERIMDLTDIPSPYLTGVFDNLMEKFPEVRWNFTMETNRGCPYQCTYCDWGSLTYGKIKKFELQRVFAELEWIGQNAIDFISFTDANFGIFPERDMMIAEKLVEVQKQYDNPKSYTLTWAKNQRAEVIEIVKVLMFEGGSTIGLNLSVQTLNDATLEAVKRKNLEMNKVVEVFEACEENGIPLFTELILGLPEETLESWKRNFFELYKGGNHTGITVYQAQLFENTEMNLTQKEQYDIESTTVYDYLVGSYNEDELREGVEVVTATATMNKHDMIEAQMVSWLQVTFHINGLTNYISRFLYKYCNEEYSDFYEKFYNHIVQDAWLNTEYERVKMHYSKWMNEGEIGHDPIEGMEIHGWNLIHSSIIQMQSKHKVNHFFDVIQDFLFANYSDVDVHLLEELIIFQKNYVIDYDQLATYPRNINVDYDFLSYIQENGELNTPTAYHFDFPEDKTQSLEKFCEKLFFDRRRNFGKAWISK